MPERTAILKGWTLTVEYIDGSRSEQFYEPDELELLDHDMSNLSLTELSGVLDLHITAEYTKPGESYYPKVKHNGN
jgi:hypothetical protein